MVRWPYVKYLKATSKGIWSIGDTTYAVDAADILSSLTPKVERKGRREYYIFEGKHSMLCYKIYISEMSKKYKIA